MNKIDAQVKVVIPYPPCNCPPDKIKLSLDTKKRYWSPYEETKVVCLNCKASGIVRTINADTILEVTSLGKTFAFKRSLQFSEEKEDIKDES